MHGGVRMRIPMWISSLLAGILNRFFRITAGWTVLAPSSPFNKKTLVSFKPNFNSAVYKVFDRTMGYTGVADCMHYIFGGIGGQAVCSRALGLHRLAVYNTGGRGSGAPLAFARAYQERTVTSGELLKQRKGLCKAWPTEDYFLPEANIVWQCSSKV